MHIISQLPFDRDQFDRKTINSLFPFKSRFRIHHRHWHTHNTHHTICTYLLCKYISLYPVIIVFRSKTAGERLRSEIAKFMAPTWGPPGSCRPQMGPMLAPQTLLSGMFPFQCIPFYINFATPKPYVPLGCHLDSFDLFIFN